MNRPLEMHAVRLMREELLVRARIVAQAFLKSGIKFARMYKNKSECSDVAQVNILFV